MTPKQVILKLTSLPKKSSVHIPCSSFSQMEALRASFYRICNNYKLRSIISITRSIHPTYSLTLYHGPKPLAQLSDFKISIPTDSDTNRVSQKV